MIETATAEVAVEELLRRIQKLEEWHRQLTQQISNKKSERPQFHHHQNILDSMGRTAYMFDVNNRIIYWNKMAEQLYGYTSAEAIGKTAPEIIISGRYSELATLIIQRAVHGETWSGQFPVRTKYGQQFTVITTLAPCRDQHGTTFGVTCVCADPRHFRESIPQSTVSAPPQRLDPIGSKISNLVKPRMKTGEMDSASAGSNENRLHKVLSAKAEAWMFKMKMGLSWPWKPPNDETSTASLEIATQLYHQTPKGYSCATSSSSSSTTDIHVHNLDVEISWDDLIIKEQIRQGSSGTVYHALLYGSVCFLSHPGMLQLRYLPSKYTLMT